MRHDAVTAIVQITELWSVVF